VGVPRLERVLVPRGRVARAAMAVAVAMAALAIGSWLVGAIAHVDDGHDIDHVAGTWMALASYDNDGTLYPPLYDGHAFGGTRFMPVPILLDAAAARVSGEYLVSGKTVSYLLAVALLVLTFVLLRNMRCPTPVALLLSSTLVLTGTGLTAALSVRNDSLPVLLQLLAVALVASSTRRAVVCAAGALCAIALVSKLSAVWALVAIGIWLWRRDRRALATFATVFVGMLALLVAVFELASDGRMTENVLGLGAAGAGYDVDRLRLMVRLGYGALAVLPVLALLGWVLALRRRQVTIYHLALAVAAIVTAVVLADPGAFVNHLIDVQVLSLLVVGDLWRRLAPASGGLSLGTTAILAVLVVCSAAAYHQNVRPRADVRALVHGTIDPRDRVPRIGEALGKNERILAEDPFIPVSRGEQPVVLDPFMLRRIVEEHPRWRRDFVRRIELHEFDKVILLYVPSEAPEWYRDLHFGSAVIAAVERSYRHAGHVDGYQLFVPR
jgi:hypothetical protein